MSSDNFMAVNMMTTDESIIGKRVASGQVTIGGLVIDVPVFDVEQLASQSECEALLLDKALEMNPDLVLARPPAPKPTCFIVRDGLMETKINGSFEVVGKVDSFNMPTWSGDSNNDMPMMPIICKSTLSADLAMTVTYDSKNLKKAQALLEKHGFADND